MTIHTCTKINKVNEVQITLPGSKSIANRLLILNKLNENKTKIVNLSNADDTKLLSNILEQLSEKKNQYTFNVKNAGTVMRFLTAFLANHEGKYNLLCDEQMKKRPINELVNVLRQLGAEINYLENQGFPPLHINGKNLISKKIQLNGSISSQYITALLLIAPTLQNGLEIELTGKITSLPYLQMTLEILQDFGINYNFIDNIISIPQQSFSSPKHYAVEADWSSAAVWFAFASLLPNKTFQLKYFDKNSIQGDSALVKIYDKLGISSIFENKVLILKNVQIKLPDFIELNLRDTPDLLTTIAINLCLLNIKFRITGIENLHIKESDRIAAVCDILNIAGYEVIETNYGTLEWNGKMNKTEAETLQMDTYSDHRFAMATSLFSAFKNVEIKNPECVEKSYPDYWKHYELIFN